MVVRRVYYRFPPSMQLHWALCENSCHIFHSRLLIRQSDLLSSYCIERNLKTRKGRVYYIYDVLVNIITLVNSKT